MLYYVRFIIVINMPPKQKFLRSDIIKAAYDIVREKGLNELSARKLAERLGSSVAPIYSHFKSIEELHRIVLKLARELLYRYVAATHTNRTLLKLIIGLVHFAGNERDLFEALFLYRDSVEFTEEFKNVMRLEMFRDSNFAATPMRDREALFERMWISVYGLAALICVGHLERDPNESPIKTMKSVESIIFASGNEKGE